MIKLINIFNVNANIYYYRYNVMRFSYTEKM